MQACPWSIEALITHRGDKILLDRVVGFDEEGLVAEATIKADSVYLKDGVEPGWMGLEYMAQAVAAFAGVRRRRIDQPPKVGMLIGSRRYRCQQPHFTVGQRLQVETRVMLEDENGLSVFKCRITEGDLIAEANLNVYQPQDIDAYLSR